mgnify:CR=1 FL=1
MDNRFRIIEKRSEEEQQRMNQIEPSETTGEPSIFNLTFCLPPFYVMSAREAV